MRRLAVFSGPHCFGFDLFRHVSSVKLSGGEHHGQASEASKAPARGPARPAGAAGARGTVAVPQQLGRSGGEAR